VVNEPVLNDGLIENAQEIEGLSDPFVGSTEDALFKALPEYDEARTGIDT
jgi:hypothetical protein